MQVLLPFTLSVHDSKPNLRELHMDFSVEFQAQSVEQRLETVRVYVASLISQAQQMQDAAEQRGVMTIIEITEQILPHIQSDSLPLDQTLIIEMGEAAEGSSLDELLNK